MSHNYKNYIGFLEVVNSNPNGDPDAGGEPRVYLDGKGHITSVSVKRKMRDYMIAQGENLICLPGTKLSGKNLSREDVLKNYTDARIFGHVVTVKKDEGTSIPIRGALHVAEVDSTHQIEVQTDSITVSFSREADKDRTMGTRSFVRYGLYPHSIDFYPTIAEKNNINSADIELIRNSIMFAYDANPSSTRQNVYWRELIEFEHVGSLYSKKTPLWMSRNCYVESSVEIPTSPNDVTITVNEEAFREAGIAVNRLITSE